MLYDIGIIKSHTAFNVPVICVGNLNLGGTGKTPFTELLISELHKHYRIGIVSRGYGRETSGFYLANDNTTAKIIGDEPFQIYQKFKNEISLAVCEDRKTGIDRLLELQPETEIIILDDAYQHRKIKAHINILLTTYGFPFYNDLLLPSGTLRDIRSAWKRCDFLVFTKSPRQIEKSHEAEAVNYTGLNLNEEIFYSKISYQTPFNFLLNTSETLLATHNILLITGIAQPIPLIEYISNVARIPSENLLHKRYPDHHNYSTSNLQDIGEIFGTFAHDKKLIVTTEKDWVKIAQLLNEDLKKLPWFVLKIAFELTAQEHFNTRLMHKIEQVKNSIKADTNK